MDLDSTTTNGQRFDEVEHRALARLMFKRFGEDKASFCAAWRRMLQNSAEDEDILALLEERGYGHRDLAAGDILRATGRRYRIRIDLLDGESCIEIRRMLTHLESRAATQARQAALQPWRHF